jgi:hypothetical protein
MTDRDHVAPPGPPRDRHPAGIDAAPHSWRTGTIPPASLSRPLRDIVDVWGEDSFPASDPPANW